MQIPKPTASFARHIQFRNHVWHSEVLTLWAITFGTPRHLERVLRTRVTTHSHGGPYKSERQLFPRPEHYVRATMRFSRLERLVSVRADGVWLATDEEDGVNARFLGAYYGNMRHRVFLRVETQAGMKLV